MGPEVLGPIITIKTHLILFSWNLLYCCFSLDKDKTRSQDVTSQDDIESQTSPKGNGCSFSVYQTPTAK